MDSTTIILKIVAVYYILSGIMMIFKKKTFALVLKDFFDHPSVPWIAGIFMGIAGLYLVLIHNVWVGDWKVILVTLFSWLILLKGIFYMFWPTKTSGLIKSFNSWAVPVGVVLIIVGAILF
jgi:hypothetical protein